MDQAQPAPRGRLEGGPRPTVARIKAIQVACMELWDEDVESMRAYSNAAAVFEWVVWVHRAQPSPPPNISRAAIVWNN